MNNTKGSLWFIRILSLTFAIWLYFNANSIALINPDSNQITQIESVAENIPINITYNQDKYFISGYSETVDVFLTSANRVLLDKESNAETRSFSVNMDLTSYEEGEYEIPLKIVGLPNSVKGTLVSDKMTVVIEPKTSRIVDLEAAVDKSIYTDGYETIGTEVNPESVLVSGAQDTVAQVDRVIAGVSDRRNVVQNFSETLKPYAVNAEGELLNVLIEPETVTVMVEVSSLSKRVKINPVQSGKIPSGIKDYTFSMQDDTVEIFGPESTLNEISQIDLNIDTSTIRETTTNSYNVIVPEDVIVSPSSVTVTVRPNEIKK